MIAKNKTKMITAPAALDALVAAGFIASYKRYRSNGGGWNATETFFEASSDKLNYVSNETFGKESYLFFSCYGPREARELVEIIRNAGGECESWNGGPDKGNVKLRVRYFKGCRWWE
jgi:hypothetical protein